MDGNPHQSAIDLAWKNYEANWDGEGALAANKKVFETALNFLFLLPADYVTPDGMLHANGMFGLCWREGDNYLEFEFLPDQRLAYYSKTPAGKDSGEGDINTLLAKKLLELIPLK